MGRVVPEYGRDSLRELIIGPYRVVYEIDEDEVGVIAVVHGSRDLFSVLGYDPGEPRNA
jgi:plasmid stabilization system protein ParE